MYFLFKEAVFLFLEKFFKKFLIKVLILKSFYNKIAVKWHKVVESGGEFHQEVKQCL